MNYQAILNSLYEILEITQDMREDDPDHEQLDAKATALGSTALIAIGRFETLQSQKKTSNLANGLIVEFEDN